MRWTIKLGTSISAFRLAVKNEGFQIGKWANDIIGKPSFRFSNKKTEINLVVKSVTELGFNKGANFDQICKAASKIGLTKCPAEIGPLLRLQYLNQPIDEWLVIAMDSIIDSEGNPRMFLIGHNNRGRWLVGDFGHTKHIYGKNKLFVFSILH